MDDVRQSVSLNGPEWRCSQSYLRAPDVTEIERVEAQSVAATVPGEVRLDLARAGLLKDDLFYGRNNEAGRWVETCDWWYWRDFPGIALRPSRADWGQGQRNPPGPSRAQIERRVWLRLHGADYFTWTFLNGQLLGQHEGMFSRQVYEVTRLIRERNRLAVRFLAPDRLLRRHSSLWEKILNRAEQRCLDVACCDPDRRDTLKCQMGYGWDFAPALRTIGLWDDVDVIVTGEVTLFDAQVKTRLLPGGAALPARATLIVSFDADALTAGPVTFVLSLAGQTFESSPVARSFEAFLPAGRTRLTFEMDVPDPCLWFPWDRGTPHLYTLTVEAQREGRVLDRLVKSVGLREIAWRRNPGAPPNADEWTLTVNGQAVYLRGANWVPADAIPARVTRDDYAALLNMARAANLNVLRVWGGGLREKTAFYDLCDRMGLLVWQEFPLACAFLTRYPRSADYLSLVEGETREIVRQVRNHPSVILWCGGNEFEPDKNQPVIEAMRRAATAEDDTRPFRPVSPAGGESHNWQVWHGFRPTEHYCQDLAQVLSEFGLQAPPAVESLQRFIPPDELWPPGRAWKYHRAQMTKLRYYQIPTLHSPLSTLHPPPSTLHSPLSTALREFVEATQRAQASGIQIAVEHARRRKYATSGFMVWQFNSPWPAIDWALVDYYGAPKLAYRRLAEIANPLLVSLDYSLRRYAPGDALIANVWVINDWLRDFPGCRVEIALQDVRQTWDVDVRSDSAEVVGRVTWTLPEGEWRVTCRLMQGEQVLSTNSYDLREYRGDRPRWRRLAALMGLELS